MNESSDLYSHINVEGNLTIPTKNPSIDYIDDIRIDIQITEQKLETSNTVPETDLNKDAYHLRVTGNIMFEMKYLAPIPDKGLHTACFEIPFEDYIHWSRSKADTALIKIQPIIEHAFFKQYDTRTIYQAISIRLDL